MKDSSDSFKIYLLNLGSATSYSFDINERTNLSVVAISTYGTRSESINELNVPASTSCI